MRLARPPTPRAGSVLCPGERAREQQAGGGVFGIARGSSHASVSARAGGPPPAGLEPASRPNAGIARAISRSAAIRASSVRRRTGPGFPSRVPNSCRAARLSGSREAPLEEILGAGRISAVRPRRLPGPPRPGSNAHLPRSTCGEGSFGIVRLPQVNERSQPVALHSFGMDVARACGQSAGRAPPRRESDGQHAPAGLIAACGISIPVTSPAAARGQEPPRGRR